MCLEFMLHGLEVRKTFGLACLGFRHLVLGLGTTLALPAPGRECRCTKMAWTWTRAHSGFRFTHFGIRVGLRCGRPVSFTAYMSSKEEGFQRARARGLEDLQISESLWVLDYLRFGASAPI